MGGVPILVVVDGDGVNERVFKSIVVEIQSHSNVDSGQSLVSLETEVSALGEFISPTVSGLELEHRVREIANMATKYGNKGR